jgi:hypothetical protein
MKFTVEIFRMDAAGVSVLHRSAMDGISPKWAKTRATTLLNAWRHRGANGVRVLNAKGEEVYNWTT